MRYEFVDYLAADRIAAITLNRPAKRNALNGQFIRELTDAFRLAENDAEAKVIILKANGPAFCAGADLDYLHQLRNNPYEKNLEDSRNLAALLKQIYLNAKVVIAQVEGPAIAGGCGLVTACDMAYAVPGAVFGYTEVKIGFLAAVVMYFLFRKAGELHGRELLITGKTIDAGTAREYGLINFVEPEATIELAVRRTAEELVNGSSETSMKMTKEMAAKIPNLSPGQALEYAAEMNARARATGDFAKGIDAFLNNRKVSW